MGSSSVWENLSNEIAGAAESVGPSVVGIRGRHRIMASGIQWRNGVIVTAEHPVRRADEVSIILEAGKSVTAAIAGRDPSTDLAVVKLAENESLPVPELSASARTLGHLVLALGRSWRGNLVASVGTVGGLAGEWRTWRGGRVDRRNCPRVPRDGRRICSGKSPAGTGSLARAGTGSRDNEAR